MTSLELQVVWGFIGLAAGLVLFGVIPMVVSKIRNR